MKINSEVIHEKGWVKVRFRRVRNSDRILDAHDYGRDYWCFPGRPRRKQ